MPKCFHHFCLLLFINLKHFPICSIFLKRLIFFTEEEMKRKTETMPRPNKIHHIVEDFLTQWDGPVSHILPLRRFLEDATNINLRHSFAEECMKKRLLFQTVPISCQQDFMKGQGLKGTPDLINLSKSAKDM